jgi:hypothetical protein
VIVSTEKERWRELCEQASKEQDPEKLLQLAEEILRLAKPQRPLQLNINSSVRRDNKQR